MSNNKIGLHGILTEEDGSPFCGIDITGSVKTVAPHLVFFIPIVGQCVHVAGGRHSLMPCCIHYGTMRYVGQHFLRSPDSGDIGRIVKRCQLVEGFKISQHLVVDDNGFCESFGTVNHTVPHGFN